MNDFQLASVHLDSLGFVRTEISNQSLSYTYFHFDGSTLAFDEDGCQWEKQGIERTPEYFERTEPVLWTPIETAA